MKLLIMVIFFFNLLYAEKIALLIGNKDYYKPSLILKNPINDIEAIADTLEGIHFEVILLKNASKRQMEDALDTFYHKVEGVEIALVYFSGHGLQVYDIDTDRVINYLLPIEAKVKKLRDLNKLIRIDRLVSETSSAKNAVILIDACRDNPLYDEISTIFRKYGTKSTAVNKGLGQIDFKTNNVLIAFATTSNRTASDGEDEELSPYAKGLSRHLHESEDISLVLRNVRNDVLLSTKQVQEPVIVKNTLNGKVCLSGSCGEPIVIERVIEKDINQQLVWIILGLVSIFIMLIVYKIFFKRYNNSEIITIDGIMYQNQSFTKSYTWEQANIYAENLRLGGYDDWRVPKREELNKISNIKIYEEYDNYHNWRKWFDKNKHKRLKNSKGNSYFISKEFIDKMPKRSCFWTSERHKDYSSSCWIVSFDSGSNFWRYDTDREYVLCIRP